MWRLDTAHEMIPPACDGGEKDAGKRSSNGDPTEPTTLHRYRLDGVCKRVLEPTANSHATGPADARHAAASWPDDLNQLATSALQKWLQLRHGGIKSTSRFRRQLNSGWLAK